MGDVLRIKEKIIIVDVDGVLLDWEYHFEKWVKEKYCYDMVNPFSYKINEKYNIPRDEGRKMARDFNESTDIAFLSPLRDAVKYIRKLHEEHGYMFHAITSLSNRVSAQKLRINNLESLFGRVFDEYNILDTGADKDDALLKYKDTGAFWIEDKPDNVDTGIRLGLNGILVAHAHNASYKGDAKRMYKWSDIYREIVS